MKKGAEIHSSIIFGNKFVLFMEFACLSIDHPQRFYAFFKQNTLPASRPGGSENQVQIAVALDNWRLFTADAGRGGVDVDTLHVLVSGL